MHTAAEGGHLVVLQEARENGCSWDMRTCSYAAMNGLLSVLQWSRENGCDWDESRVDMCTRRCGRAPGGVAVGAGAPLRLGRDDLRIRR